MLTSNGICDAVAASVSSLQSALRSLTLPSLTISEFWNLQDDLGRLVEKASDSPTEIFETLRCEYSGLVSDTLQVLQVAAKLRLTRNIAIRESCSAINDHLMRLEYLKQEQAAEASV